MSDNPFAEPDDSNRTIIRPNPGRRRSAAPAQAPAPQPVGGDTRAEPSPRAPDAAAARVAEGTENIHIGDDVLTAAAGPLLQFMARLRNTANPPDSGDLYQRTVHQIRLFEVETRDKGVPLEQLRPAHYALCASLDDVVLNTPWGNSGTWAERSLVSTFHKEVRAGERFFDVLKQMCDNPGRFLPVIKLMYLCMSLGFVGQYRLSRRGLGDLNKIREETYAVIARQQKAADADLAPHTKGINAPYRPARFSLPLWVAAVACLGLVGGLFLWFSISLNAASDGVYASLQGAPPERMPTITRTPFVEAKPVVVVTPPPPPPEPSALDKLREFLKPEIEQKLVEVLGTPAQPLVRITGRGMFASASATVNESFKPLLDRIGLALKDEQGPVKVIGYTDSEPIRTIAFPSNFQLSAARAQAASKIIAMTIGDPARLSTEGRAEADPIDTNATPQGRERNRRIEIVLNRQGT
ncbi:MAG: type VI secretion system protein TssL, long form [Reyranella sp.]|uniref:type VI secretion system protein TssL, long form n=1 Tax=Reyranella sp. TaxID=1929291 RepID=UPI003D0D9CAF